MRSPSRRPVAVSTALAVSLVLLGACERQAGDDRPDRASTASAPVASPSTAAPTAPRAGQRRSGSGETTLPTAQGLPASPTLRPAGALAAHIATAEAILRSPRTAAPEELRRAAEFQQLAARLLGTAPDRAVAKVLRRLDPAARRVTVANARAAGLLGGMTSPQTTLPQQWRIVTPPPPRQLIGHYKRAGRATGVPWGYLAAIHLVETRMGRIRGTSTAGAQGPMQFMPATWEAYGAGGDINDPGDAIMAAARLLRANGAPRRMDAALWNYNHSDAYVQAVTAYAEVMRRSPAAFHGYWHWRVLYKHRDGTYVLPEGYPDAPPELIG